MEFCPPVRTFPREFQFSFIVDETFTLNVEEDTSEDTWEDDPNIGSPEATQENEDTVDPCNSILRENNSNFGAADDDSESELVIDLEYKEYDDAEAATKDENEPHPDLNITNSSTLDDTEEAQPLTVASESLRNWYQCASCSFYTNTPANLIKHTEQHKTGFECSACEFKTESADEMDHHKRQCKGKKTEPRLRCPKCHVTTTKLTSLNKHIRIYHSDNPVFTCPKCPFSTSKWGLVEKHKSTHKNKTFKCGVCDFQSKTRLELKTHHSEKHSFKCDRCSFRTSTLADLEKHAARHVINNGQYRCRFCRFSDHSAEIIAVHEGNHLKKKHNIRFRCKFCNFRDHSADIIAKHEENHSKKKSVNGDS